MDRFLARNLNASIRCALCAPAGNTCVHSHHHQMAMSDMARPPAVDPVDF